MRNQHPDLQPNLVGTLIRLRPLNPKDFDALYESASDPRIWEQHPQPDRHRKEVFQTYFDGAIQSKGALAVIDRVTGEIIGSSRFYNLDPGQSRITIGYTFLRREYWGGRFNRELKSLMLRHAFRFVDTVFFEIGKMNLRSRKAIERIGARPFGEVELGESTHVVYQIQKGQPDSLAASLDAGEAEG